MTTMPKLPDFIQQCEVYNIKWFGKDYLLIGPSKESGAIATKEQFENFEMSTAQLMPDGRIYRNGFVIGFKEELVIGDKAEDYL